MLYVMDGLQSRGRKEECLSVLPSLALSLLARCSPVMVPACCSTMDLCRVMESLQGEAGREMTPPGGAGGHWNVEGELRERGLALASPSTRHLLGGCREGPRDGGEVRGAMGPEERAVCPGSEMLRLKESLSESLLFSSPPLIIVCVVSLFQ